jgi:hypothetical protein
MNLPAKPAAATEADPDTELRQMLASAAAALQALHQQAIEALAPAVQDILRSNSHDAQRVEHTLDPLLNHACLPEGLALFKTLCRHCASIDPQATASCVRAYREMWDSDDQNDGKEMQA